MGGWLEKVKIKLNSTQVVVEVEVIVELGNIYYLTVGGYPLVVVPASNCNNREKLPQRKILFFSTGNPCLVLLLLLHYSSLPGNTLIQLSYSSGNHTSQLTYYFMNIAYYITWTAA